MVVATIAQPDGPVAGLHSDKAAIEACEPLLIHFTGHPFAQFALRHRPQPFGSEFAGEQSQAMGYIVAVYHEIRAACIDAADDDMAVWIVGIPMGCRDRQEEGRVGKE